MIGVRSSLPSVRVDSWVSPSGEAFLLCVDVLLSSKSIRLINLYVSGAVIPDPLLDLVGSLLTPLTFLGGDFNAHHTAFGSSRNSRGGVRLVNWFLTVPLCLLNDGSHTYFRWNYSAPLDLSFCSPELFGSSSWSVCQDSFLSDHFPLLIRVCSLDSTPASQPLVGIPTTHWGVTFPLLRELCLQADVLQGTIRFQDFFPRIRHILLTHTVFRPRMVRRLTTPWWDAECQELVRRKRRMLKIARRRVSLWHWGEYKRTEGLLRRLIRVKRRAHWNSVIQGFAIDQSIYRFLRRLRERHLSSPGSHQVLLHGSRQVSAPADQAALFGRCCLAAPAQVPLPSPELAVASPHFSCLISPFSLREGWWATNRTRTRSPGPDGITVLCFKNLLSWAPGYVVAMFNHFLRHGFVHPSWKEGYVIPIRKPGKPSNLSSSYRPIIITSISSKIFERLILQRLLTFIQETGIWSDCHYGFYPGRSTDAYLAALHHNVLVARERRHFILLCSVDLAQAYDSVQHDLLFRKLSRLGIGGSLLLWIKAFVCDRSAQVRWRDCLSPPFRRGVGLPQGAVLSPILFSLFIHDLEGAVHPQVSSYVYADDICLLATSHHWATACGYLQNSLSSLSGWSSTNSLAFSPGKSGILNLSRRPSASPVSFFLQGQPVLLVPRLRVLGVWFQDSLSWGVHLGVMKSRVVRRISLLRLIGHPSWGLSGDLLLRIMNRTIVPLITYAFPVLFSVPCSVRLGMASLYHSALRVCLGLPRQTPIDVLLCESGCPSLDVIFHLRVLRFLLQHTSMGRDSPLHHILSGREALRFYSWGPCHLPVAMLLNLHEESGFLDLGTLRGGVLVAPSFLPVKYRVVLQSWVFQSKSLPQDCIVRDFTGFTSMLPEGAILVGTDAAWRDRSCAIGVVSSTGVHLSVRISGSFSVFSAEALALIVALTHCACGPVPLFVCSDSLSVLSALDRVGRSSHPIILELHLQLNALAVRGTPITLVWVPGHSGIWINEAADSAAVAGLRSLHVSPHKVPWPDLFRISQRSLFDGLRTAWGGSRRRQRLPYLQVLSPWLPPVGLPRRAETLIRRMRTDMLPLNANLHQWRLLDSPMCVRCGVRESLSHFMFHCPLYAAPRSSLFREVGHLGPDPLVALLDLSSLRQPNRRIWQLWSFLSATARFA